MSMSAAQIGGVTITSVSLLIISLICYFWDTIMNRFNVSMEKREMCRKNKTSFCLGATCVMFLVSNFLTDWDHMNNDTRVILTSAAAPAPASYKGVVHFLATIVDVIVIECVGLCTLREMYLKMLPTRRCNMFMVAAVICALSSIATKMAALIKNDPHDVFVITSIGTAAATFSQLLPFLELCMKKEGVTETVTRDSDRSPVLNWIYRNVFCLAAYPEPRTVYGGRKYYDPSDIEAQPMLLPEPIHVSQLDHYRRTWQYKPDDIPLSEIDHYMSTRDKPDDIPLSEIDDYRRTLQYKLSDTVAQPMLTEVPEAIPLPKIPKFPGSNRKTRSTRWVPKTRSK